MIDLNSTWARVNMETWTIQTNTPTHVDAYKKITNIKKEMVALGHHSGFELYWKQPLQNELILSNWSSLIILNSEDFTVYWVQTMKFLAQDHYDFLFTIEKSCYIAFQMQDQFVTQQSAALRFHNKTSMVERSFS